MAGTSRNVTWHVGIALARLLPAALMMLMVVLAPSGDSRAAVDAGEAARMVARLDTVRTARDPAVREVAALGDAVIPLLVQKLGSDRRMTAIGASWALRHMASPEAFAPLLERLASPAPESEKERVRDALRMLMTRRLPYAVDPSDADVVSLFAELTAAVICSEVAVPAGCEEHRDVSRAEPLFLYGEGVTAAADLSCFGRSVQVLPSGAFRDSDHLVGRDYVRLAMEIHEIPVPGAPMPYWVASNGARPEALAMVQVMCGRVGGDFEGNSTGTLWALSAGKWDMVARLYEMTVD